jgi:hypothetical protein
MSLFRSFAALLSILLLSLDSVDAFAPKKTHVPTTRLSVAKDVMETQEQEVPYAISRGDGSTGGGGLPMPQQEDDGLMRPKVSPITTCRFVFHRFSVFTHITSCAGRGGDAKWTPFLVPCSRTLSRYSFVSRFFVSHLVFCLCNLPFPFLLSRSDGFKVRPSKGFAIGTQSPHGL